jgi:hypothetical protein
MKIKNLLIGIAAVAFGLPLIVGTIGGLARTSAGTPKSVDQHVQAEIDARALNREKLASENRKASHEAPDPAKAKDLADEIEKTINSLVDFTHTYCAPSRGTEPNTYCLIVLADKQVLSTDESRKAWLLTVVGAAGKLLNDNPGCNIDQLILADKEMAQSRKGLVLRVEIAKRLQQSVSSGSISLSQMYQALEQGLTSATIPKL